MYFRGVGVQFRTGVPILFGVVAVIAFDLQMILISHCVSRRFQFHYLLIGKKQKFATCLFFFLLLFVKGTILKALDT